MWAYGRRSTERHPDPLLRPRQYPGCYGIDVETTEIDALANCGALIEDHFGPASQCSPSRGSLAAGRYSHLLGLMGLYTH